MSHIGEIEKIPSRIFHSRELCFKKWCKAIRTATMVLRIKVKVVSIPPGINVHYVTEMLIFGRGFDMGWLQERFDKISRFCFYLYLYIFRYFRFGRSWWTKAPNFLFFFHDCLINIKSLFHYFLIGLSVTIAS